MSEAKEFTTWGKMVTCDCGQRIAVQTGSSLQEPADRPRVVGREEFHKAVQAALKCADELAGQPTSTIVITAVGAALFALGFHREVGT